jgi:hypothetical protein
MTLFNSCVIPAHRTKQDGIVNSCEDLVEHRAQTLAAHHDNAVRALRRKDVLICGRSEPSPHDTSVRIAHTIVMFLGFLIRVCTTAGMQRMMQHPLAPPRSVAKFHTLQLTTQHQITPTSLVYVCVVH